jgi:hypothetical protein
MTTASMASPSNKCHSDDDEGPPSSPPSAPLRQRVGDKVGVVVPPVAEAAVPPLAAEKVVSVPQDDNGSDGKGSSSDDGEGSGSDDNEDKVMDNDEDKVMYKCPICLGEEYDFEAKVVLHALEVIKQDAGTSDVVERHRQVLQAR